MEPIRRREKSSTVQERTPDSSAPSVVTTVILAFRRGEGGGARFQSENWRIIDRLPKQIFIIFSVSLYNHAWRCFLLCVNVSVIEPQIN
jgi:hypothetical protein